MKVYQRALVYHFPELKRKPHIVFTFCHFDPPQPLGELPSLAHTSDKHPQMYSEFLRLADHLSVHPLRSQRH